MTQTNPSRPTAPSSRLSRWLAGLTTRRLVVLMLFILIFALAIRAPVDSDTWWHLRTGDWIVAHHQVPLTDPFSFTKLDQPWIDHSWGSQLIMVAFYHLLGNAGLAIFTALLATGGMIVVYRMCEGNEYQRAFILVLATATAAVFWSARPQMLSFFLSAITLYIIYLYKWRKRDRLWLLPIWMIVWVNLHGGYAIGFILLFGAIAGEIFGRLFDRQNPDVLPWPNIGRLIAFTAIAAVVLVINPNTVQMWGYPFRTFGIGVLQKFIQEWASPDFHGRETWAFLFLLLGTFAAVGLGKRRIDWTDLVLTCGVAFMSFYSGRNIATFAIVAAPVLSRHLTSLLEERGIRLARPRPARGFGLALNVTILILTILGAGLKTAVSISPKAIAAAQTQYLPVNAANYLNQAKLASAGHMFNSYNWGGYLMFAAPDYPVFVDGRTDLYDDQLLTQWYNATNGKDWQATFQQWQIKLAVIERESVLANLLSREPGWQQIYQDEQATIFQWRGQ